MDDEFKEFADGRPAVPPYRPEARFRAREALMRETRRGGLRLPRLGWQAVAAFGVTITLVGGVAVALSGQGGQTSAASGTVTRTAAQFFPELRPRPGQFILIESDTMHAAYAYGKDGEESRHLYRTYRKFYQSVDGRADGLLFIEGRAPVPWPGQELPAEAREWEGGSWNRLASCPDRMGELRDDYAYLSGLDPATMRERFYRDETSGKVSADEQAFGAAGELVRESYLPRAQREGLFEAVKAIPGVRVAEGVADSSGRRGTALGLASRDGTLRQLIFDRDTYTFLGERATVVDARVAGAPEGSLLAHTAQLNVSVVDRLPEVDVEHEDSSCADEHPATPSPVPGEDSPADEPAAVPEEARPATPTPIPAEDFPAEEPSADVPAEEPAARPVPTPTG